MKVLVTGGGGFIGGHVARLLVARGDEVTVLNRRRYPELEALGMTPVCCDLQDAEAVARACRGMDAVVHTAALASIWGPRRVYWAINVDGTANVIAGCRSAGVGKLLYTSSPSVVFGGQELAGADESTPYPPRYLAHYPASKAAAEKLVLAANDKDFATMALRPHLVWGPGDPHLLPTVVARARAGRLVQVGPGTNLVDVTFIDNASAAHVLALDALEVGAPCAGRPYFISQDDPVMLWPWLDGILEAIGAPRVTKKVSFRAAYAAGAVIEAFQKLRGSQETPWMTRFLSTQLSQAFYFDISAARRDLGYTPTVSMAAGMERLLPWLRGESAPAEAGAAVAS